MPAPRLPLANTFGTLFPNCAQIHGLAAGGFCKEGRTVGIQPRPDVPGDQEGEVGYAHDAPGAGVCGGAG